MGSANSIERFEKYAPIQVVPRPDSELKAYPRYVAEWLRNQREILRTLSVLHNPYIFV